VHGEVQIGTYKGLLFRSFEACRAPGPCLDRLNCSALSTSDKMNYITIVFHVCSCVLLCFFVVVFVLQQVTNVIGSRCVSVPEPFSCLYFPCLCSCKRPKLINK
jgi:hypothetical protein